MLTKKEIMRAFSAIGCNVEDQKAEENWFFFTKEKIHFEVQIDVEWEDSERKYIAILCPTMGKVSKKYNRILEHAVEVLQNDLKEQGISQYMVNYNAEECSVDSCGIMSYSDRSEKELRNALESFFVFDANVNEAIQKNVGDGIRAMNEEEEDTDPEENSFDLFQLQFMCIPTLLKGVENNYDNVRMLLDFEFWKECIKEMGYETFGFNWEDIKSELYAANENLEFILYTFPFPQREGLALYGMVVIDKTGKYPYKYYTLEHPGEDYLEENGGPTEWFVCGQTEDEHENFGIIELTSVGDFANAVLSLYEDLLSE